MLHSRHASLMTTVYEEDVKTATTPSNTTGETSAARDCLAKASHLQSEGEDRRLGATIPYISDVPLHACFYFLCFVTRGPVSTSRPAPGVCTGGVQC